MMHIAEKSNSTIKTGIICFLLGCIFIISGCSQTTDSETTCCIGTFKAVVHGSVTDQMGKPVGEAAVEVRHHPDGCEDELSSEKQKMHVNDQTGLFEELYRISERRDDSCFLAEINLPDTSSFTIPALKQFDVTFQTESPYDSVKVDFILE